MPEERVEREEVNTENRQPNTAKINPEEEELEESKKKAANKQQNPSESNPEEPEQEEKTKKEEKKTAQTETLSFDEELAELLYGDKKKAANMQCYTFYFDDRKWGLSRVFNRQMSMKNARREAGEDGPKGEINLQAAKEGRLFVVSDKAPYLQKVTIENGKIKLVVVNENPIRIPDGLSGNEAKAWNNLKSNFEKLVQGNTAEAHWGLARSWRNRQAKNCVDDIVKQAEKVRKEDMREAEKNAKKAKKSEESRQNSKIIDINEEVEREVQREEAPQEEAAHEEQENVQENAPQEEAQREQVRENAQPEAQQEEAAHEEPKADQEAADLLAQSEKLAKEAQQQEEKLVQEAQQESEKLGQEVQQESEKIFPEAQQKEDLEVDQELEDLSREVEKKAEQKEEPEIDQELEKLSREVEKKAEQKEEPEADQELEDFSGKVEAEAQQKEAQPEEKEKDTSDLVSEAVKLIAEAKFKEAAANVAKAMQNLSGRFEQSTFLDQNAIESGMTMSGLMDIAKANKGVMSELEKLPEFKENKYVYQGQQNLAEMGDLGQKARMRLEAEHQRERTGRQFSPEQLQKEKDTLLEVMAGEFACYMVLEKSLNMEKSQMMKMVEKQPDAKMFIQGFKEKMENSKVVKDMLMENPKHLQEELSDAMKRQGKYRDMLREVKVDRKKQAEKELQKEKRNERKNEKDSMVLSNQDKRMKSNGM